MATANYDTPPASRFPANNRKDAPGFATRRLSREWKTIEAMVRLFCRARHGSPGALCRECQSLLEYAGLRLDRCRFGVYKPTCAKCPVHCYQLDRREQIKTVMRFAGPRMLWRHPILSAHHWLDSLSSRRWSDPA